MCNFHEKLNKIYSSFIHVYISHNLTFNLFFVLFFLLEIFSVIFSSSILTALVCVDYKTSAN